MMGGVVPVLKLVFLAERDDAKRSDPQQWRNMSFRLLS
jgi:hypothetical protein